MSHHNFTLDIETQATTTNASVTSIGMVYLELDHAFQIQRRDTFYLRTIPHIGADKDPETLAFWAQQSAEARAEVDLDNDLPRVAEPLALELLARFMNKCCPDKQLRKVWGNGPSFDNAIIQAAYRRYPLEQPWEYWNNRDVRTLVELYPDAKRLTPFKGIKHHALHDAEYEADIVALALAMHYASQGERPC